MVADITTAVVGIVGSVGNLLTPTASTVDGVATPSNYTYILAIVGVSAIFAMSRRVLKKLRQFYAFRCGGDPSPCLFMKRGL